MMKANLSEHTALITGAGKRIGRAFAEALSRNGCSVVAHYGKSRSGAEEVVEFARSQGVRAACVQADLASAEETVTAFRDAVDAVGEIDILINNASIFDPEEFLETDVELWDRSHAVNLRAPYLLAQEFARHRDGRPGAIVNMLDWRALRPGADHFAYTIAKAGLAALTRSLAQALAPAIRVNGLALGAILPPSDGGGIPVAERKKVPAGRIGSVEDVVDTMLFLVGGPEYITGEIIHVDGGRQLT
jgi:NAD(P)-dependent dehydrogenase (short-subunit alcohol dehydrogenase family)